MTDQLIVESWTDKMIFINGPYDGETMHKYKGADTIIMPGFNGKPAAEYVVVKPYNGTAVYKKPSF